MEILRFSLGGRNAFFKKPEVNSYCYYTYGNIHKVALLGMFGAILGYGGYTQMQGFEKEKRKKEISEGYPEFYERLKELKLSILPSPEHSKGYIPKKVQIYNNSVGYASKELGGNLIIKEQWLESPKWEICLLIDSKEARKVRDAICNRTCVYYPYLGKNDHLANISEVRVEEVQKTESYRGRLNCLVPKEEVEIAEIDFDELDELDVFGDFKYEEALPIAIDSCVNQYILKTFLYTDALLMVKNIDVYQLRDEKKIVFY